MAVQRTMEEESESMSPFTHTTHIILLILVYENEVNTLINTHSFLSKILLSLIMLAVRTVLDLYSMATTTIGLSREREVDTRVMVGTGTIVQNRIVDTLHVAVHDGTHWR